MTRPGRIPEPSGVLSTMVVRALTAGEQPRSVPRLADLGTIEDPITDRDFQLALWLLYELHYRGFDGVDPALEWDPLLLSARTTMEGRFEEAVRSLAAPPAVAPDSRSVVDALVAMTRPTEPSTLVRLLQRHATREQFREYLAAGAVFRLHEADPQAFALPRIGGRAKAPLAELLYDEYGAGRPDRVHARIYTRALESLGMTTEPASYVEEAGATTLAAVNLMSLFGLNRRLRGAALGHLAAYEATSSLPCRAIADGARRLGLPEPVVDYFDEHVEADAVHEQLAIRDICGVVVEEQPELAEDVVLGAAACLAVEGLAGDALVARWRDLTARPMDLAGLS